MTVVEEALKVQDARRRWADAESIYIQSCFTFNIRTLHTRDGKGKAKMLLVY